MYLKNIESLFVAEALVITEGMDVAGILSFSLIIFSRMKSAMGIYLLLTLMASSGDIFDVVIFMD